MNIRRICEVRFLNDWVERALKEAGSVLFPSPEEMIAFREEFFQRFERLRKQVCWDNFHDKRVFPSVTPLSYFDGNERLSAKALVLSGELKTWLHEQCNRYPILPRHLYDFHPRPETAEEGHQLWLLDFETRG